MGRRIVAYLIDVVIGWAVMFAVFWSVSDVITNVGSLSCDDENAPALCLQFGDTIRFAEGGDASLVTISGIAVWALLGIIVQGLTGATPGKFMLGLRVIRQDDGHLAGIGRCAARTVMWVVDAFPYVIPLVALITSSVTKGHRRVGDMAAGTFVVRAESVGIPPVVPGLTVADAATWAPPPAGGAPGGWVPPTGPPAQAPPPADLADPFASPPGQVFPSPGLGAQPSAPSSAAPPPVADQPPPPPPPPDDRPRWDADRNAYLWFDQGRQQWMIHDAVSDQWRPL